MWRRARKGKKLVERFVSAVNARDIDTVASLMAPNFTYIDSWREGVSGREQVLAAFGTLLASDPDFSIEVDRFDWRSPHVLMSGRVNSRNFGMGRKAVWQVTVRDGMVTQYQAWAEGGPPPMSRMLAPGGVADMSARAQARPDIDADQTLL